MPGAVQVMVMSADRNGSGAGVTLHGTMSWCSGAARGEEEPEAAAEGAAQNVL